MEQALRQAGYEAAAPTQMPQGAKKVHSQRYLDFWHPPGCSGWRWTRSTPPRKPFPSVWPVRTLRSDVEPTNFIAKLGLYSMDNGTPLAQGTWEAAKAGADAAASAAMRIAAGAPAAFCCTGHRATMLALISWAATAF